MRRAVRQARTRKFAGRRLGRTCKPAATHALRRDGRGEEVGCELVVGGGDGSKCFSFKRNRSIPTGCSRCFTRPARHLRQISIERPPAVSNLMVRGGVPALGWAAISVGQWCVPSVPNGDPPAAARLLRLGYANRDHAAEGCFEYIGTVRMPNLITKPVTAALPSYPLPQAAVAALTVTPAHEPGSGWSGFGRN